MILQEMFCEENSSQAWKRGLGPDLLISHTITSNVSGKFLLPASSFRPAVSYNFQVPKLHNVYIKFCLNGTVHSFYTSKVPDAVLVIACIRNRFIKFCTSLRKCGFEH